MTELYGGNMVFPIHDTGTGAPFDEGMSLRDYMAVQAMQAYIQIGHPNIYELSRESYRVADAMLEVRSGEQ
jgi:hypothetical protein